MSTLKRACGVYEYTYPDSLPVDEQPRDRWIDLLDEGREGLHCERGAHHNEQVALREIGLNL
jgi:hypothetical protein